MKFETHVYSPWALVRHEGALHLAFITSMGGGGMVPGPVTGYRGHIVSDSGQPTSDSQESRWFNPGQMVHDWRVKPSLDNLNKARARA